jgi:hypothetical protein
VSAAKAVPITITATKATARAILNNFFIKSYLLKDKVVNSLMFILAKAQMKHYLQNAQEIALNLCNFDKSDTVSNRFARFLRLSGIIFCSSAGNPES